jgi:uncharacterized membrane protein
MNLLFWGMTLSVLGKVMIAAAVVMAHSQLAHEHRIDAKVIRTFSKERTITIFGVFLIVLGYLLEVYFFGGFGTLLMCSGPECAAALGNALIR